MYTYMDRDLSWLSFNERVLQEAANENVPLMERVRFLSIYSSNLDEFYRVRVPALMALARLGKKSGGRDSDMSSILEQVSGTVSRQLDCFGRTLRESILPALEEKGITLVYDREIPAALLPGLRNYFFSHVLGLLVPVRLSRVRDFFPENNQLYALLVLREGSREDLVVINIPSASVPRFRQETHDGRRYFIFLEDIIRANVSFLFPGWLIDGFYCFKVTRDAEIDLQDDYAEDLVEKMEKQLARRDFGLATRVLYDQSMPPAILQQMVTAFRLENGNIVQGGPYHNLKDMASLPVNDAALSYDKWPVLPLPGVEDNSSLLEQISRRDIILHTPYQSFDAVLRFFNEAATDPRVREVYTTLYRVAERSEIVNALITAARNGKKVTVLVELKARFDETNNIKWAKRMKAAGVRLHYSPVSLKVHAKTALVKGNWQGRSMAAGLFSTGNLNESTARFYTDHILFTAHPGMMQELELLFRHFAKKKEPVDEQVEFRHLLVARFNLRQRFIDLVDREISNAAKGLPARIRIKLNNLEEKDLVRKLYEASRAGVKVELLVRGICCLVPQQAGMSENITVKRIVDRYLEHGRIFIFHNEGRDEVWLGSADWMNRNIYRRIEVCFPVYDEAIRNEIIALVELQLLTETATQKAVYDHLAIRPF